MQFQMTQYKAKALYQGSHNELHYDNDQFMAAAAS